MENWRNTFQLKLTSLKPIDVNRIMGIYCAVYAVACMMVVFSNLGLHGDEFHFYPTIRQFAEDPSWNTLLYYNELTTPLTFIFYAAFGTIANLDILTLRLFSVIISVATLYSIYKLGLVYLSDHFKAFVLVLLFSLNPYFIGLSIYVYTDMLTLFFMFWVFIFYKNNHAVGYALAAAAAILCRQHSLLIILSVLFSHLFIGFYKKDKIQRSFVFASLLSFVPSFLLFYFWNGLTPNGPMSEKMRAFQLVYEPSAITTYLFSIALYSIPLILYYRKDIFMIAEKYWLLGFSLLYFLFPVKPALCAVKDGVFSVGIFHKSLIKFLSPIFVDSVLYVFFTAGVFLVFYFFKHIKIDFQKQTNLWSVAMGFSILTFVIIMPFSFQIWEKYVLIILPSSFILLLKQHNH